MANNTREQWASKIGFILAAAGSAIGLGNIWRFPYLTGKYGGGAFVLIYIVCIAFVAIPIMVAEIVIGRKTQKNVVGAFWELKGIGNRWQVIGWLGMISGFVILSYYSIVGGWIIDYVVKSFTFTFQDKTPENISFMFNSLLSSPYKQVTWHALFIFINIGVVFGGIEHGIERWNKLMMPSLFFLLIVLLVNSLLSDGVKEGLIFLYYPDFSKVNITMVLECIGQAFFSLSVGMGAMITYGSYLKKDAHIPKAALSVAGLDLGVALLCGMVIFPIVFTYSMEPASGPGLIFKTLPITFSKMAYGQIIAPIFFTLVLFAAITSAISLLEVVVAFFIDELNWSRQKATLIIGTLIFLVGIPSALSSNIWSKVLFFGKTIFDFSDMLATNYMLPLGGLLISIFMGWFIEKSVKIEEICHGMSGKITYTIWNFLIKTVTPAAVFLIILQKLNILSF
ncbi:MAG: sodium-dependent transporter [Thermodesulfobacteriota bacterium]|nr:sodium-dependent transporter [Thermodesulfobacteriota bacterium]